MNQTTEAKNKTDNARDNELQRLKEWGEKWVARSIQLEEQLRINQQQLWNKISDGLPPNGLLVNYFTSDGLMGLGYCYMSSVNPDFTPMWSDINDENPIEKNITHWMRVVPPNNF